MASPFSQLRSYQRNLRYQGYQSVPVEQFGGLNLASDPTEIGWGGAIDLLNTDFSRPGTLRPRSGYTAFNSTAGSATVFYWPKAAANILSTEADAALRAYGDTGTLIATQAAIGTTFWTDSVIYNTPTTSTAYTVTPNGLVAWDGAAFTNTAASSGASVAVTPWDNRLVIANRGGSHATRVSFSDAGAPTTFGANNFVDLVGGRSNSFITALRSWNNLLFAFMDSRFSVFYGTAEDADGNPIFNYRDVETNGVGVHQQACAVAGREGVYFASTDGIYLTTGSSPVKISSELDPLFRNELVPFFTGVASLSGLQAQSMTYAGGRLFVGLSNGTGTGPAGTLVYFADTKQWSLYDILGYGLATGGEDRIIFANVSTKIGTHYFRPTYTTDNGAAITSRYRSGFYNVPGRSRADGRQVIRQWKLRGTGTPTFAVSADDATAIPTTGGGAQATVDLAGPYPNYRTAQLGYDFSWQVSSTSAFSLSSVEADIA